MFYSEDTFPNMDPDLLIQYIWKDGVLEIAIVNELRDLLRADKTNGPLCHIPKEFGICGNQRMKRNSVNRLGMKRNLRRGLKVLGILFLVGCWTMFGYQTFTSSNPFQYHIPGISIGHSTGDHLLPSLSVGGRGAMVAM